MSKRAGPGCPAATIAVYWCRSWLYYRAGTSGLVIEPHIFCAFHFPRLNSNAVAPAMEHSAITIAQYTPLD